jgi:hypothetical protein
MLLVDYMILLTGSRFLKATENRQDFSFGAKEFFSSIKRKSLFPFLLQRFKIFSVTLEKILILNFPLFSKIKIDCQMW